MGTYNTLDHPGVLKFFVGYGPAPVLGKCPHECKHNMLSVIAYGPDWEHYELLTCDAPEGCNGECRGWRVVTSMDDSSNRIRRWLHVGEQTVLPRDKREIVLGV